MRKTLLAHYLHMIRCLHIDMPLHDQWKHGDIFGESMGGQTMPSHSMILHSLL